MGKYGRLIKRLVDNADYLTQAAMRQFVLNISHRMEVQGLSRKALAEKLNTSPAYVTKVLRGDVNFTLETMTKMALAVDGRLRIEVVDRNVRWRASAWHSASIQAGRAAAQSEKIRLNVQDDVANQPSFDYQTVTRIAA